MKKLFICLILSLFGFNLNSAGSFDNNKSGESEVETSESEVKFDNIFGTVYHPFNAQTDDSPSTTADGSIIDIYDAGKHKWVALSRELINCPLRADKLYNAEYPNHWKGEFSFGDTILVYHDDNRLIGEWVVHDCMNERYIDRIDFLQGEDGFYGTWKGIVIAKK